MAITTYAELQTAVGKWLADQVSADLIPDFIALAEKEMSRLLYDNAAETTTSTATTSGTDYIAIPADCRAVRAVRLDEQGRKSLDFVAPAAWASLRTSGTGRPSIYTVEGQRIRFSPVPDGAYTVETLYQQGVTALSDTDTTNNLFPKHADAYLYGALEQAYDYLMDEARAAKFKSKFEEAMVQVRLETDRVRFPGVLQRRGTYREMR